MASAADCNAFLSALKRLGGSVGNGRLREALGWPEDRYWAAQTALLDAGALISGRGRGGSFSLPTAAATAQAIATAQPDRLATLRNGAPNARTAPSGAMTESAPVTAKAVHRQMI
jgi:hypothetical protein